MLLHTPCLTARTLAPLLIAAALANTASAQVQIFRDRALWEAALAGHNVQRNMFVGVGGTWITAPIRVDANTVLTGPSTYHGHLVSVSSDGVSVMNDSPWFSPAELRFDTPVYAFGANIGQSSLLNPSVTVTISGWSHGLPPQTFAMDPPGGFWGFYSPNWQVDFVSAQPTGGYSQAPFGWSFGGGAVYAIVPAPSTTALTAFALATMTMRRRRADKPKR